MILIIALILTFLVALNFLLLIVSCNKTTKGIVYKRPQVIKQEKPVIVASPLQTRQLAPTGS